MGELNFIAQGALVAFFLVVALAFAALPPRRAALWTLMGGWLFLPHFDGNHSLLFLHSKAMFVPAVVLLGSVTLDLSRWLKLRPSLLDLPVLVLSAVPFPTALANGLGLKEAVAATLANALSWGAAYLLGRTYYGRPRSLRELAEAVVVAALVYVPFCLWEVRMSPQLHVDLYGFRTWSFDQALRGEGFRPAVFMQHGLAVGTWMATGTLVAYWLTRTGSRPAFAGIPAPVACALLAVTTLLCRSTAAIALLALGAGVLEVTRRMRTGLLVLLLAAAPAVYCGARIAGWSARSVVATSRQVFGEDRAASLQFRIDNEKLLTEKAMRRPWLGWGRFGRSFVYDEEGRNVGAITDGMWIIVLGMSGLVGLVSLGLLLTAPPLSLLRAFPGRLWADPRLAPAAALALALLLWAMDEVLNAMMAPLFPLISGALVSLVLLVQASRAKPRYPGRGRDHGGAVAGAVPRPRSSSAMPQ